LYGASQIKKHLQNNESTTKDIKKHIKKKVISAFEISLTRKKETT
jgi:hypothetical protein